MKTRLLSLLLLFVLAGCSYGVRVSPLKGTYQQDPYIVLSDKPFSQVWDNLIDILAIQAFPIKLLDKENGLVVCERTSLGDVYTFEDKNGKLEDPYAYLVVPNVSVGGFSRTHPTVISGVVTIRVRQAGNQTYINANLTSFQAESASIPSSNNQYAVWSQIASTGIFEDFIVNKIR